MTTQYIQVRDPVEEAEQQARKQARREQMLLLWVFANLVWILLLLGTIFYYYFSQI